MPTAVSQKEVEFAQIPLDAIERNPNQPRKEFDEAALQELAASIKELGIQTPINVRRISGDGKKYEIIAGERRWRAAKQAGLTHIGALICDVTDEESFLRAIVENVQREDLGPIEEAMAYRVLFDQCGENFAAVAEKVSKSRPHVESRLALLSLPPEVQKLANDGKLSLGCAELLTGLEQDGDILKYARIAVQRGLTPHALKAAIQSLSKKGKDGGDGKGRGNRKITSRVFQGALIACYDGVSKVNIATIPREDAPTLRSQTLILIEELQKFVGAIDEVHPPAVPAGA